MPDYGFDPRNAIRHWDELCAELSAAGHDDVAITLVVASRNSGTDMLMMSNLSEPKVRELFAFLAGRAGLHEDRVNGHKLDG